LAYGWIQILPAAAPQHERFLRLSGHAQEIPTIDWTKLTGGFRYTGTRRRTVIVDVDVLQADAGTGQ